ncbi:MAG: transcription elongation factor GreA [Candidatus Pacebacteria bacterium]|jgi:transcription elongation factor GreA|nr:transcription elongation factor GreA [Candidatus Paceibacterota bacterium]
MQETQYLTKEKFAELKSELEQLRNVRRREVAESLEYAKKLGDLSENAEYHEAREEQAKVEDRIGHLEMVLKTANILDEKHGSTVSIGSTVLVQKEGEKENRKFMIVGSEEVDTANGKLSNHSPIGAALMGKTKGDTISVLTPKGKVSYKIIDLQ